MSEQKSILEQFEHHITNYNLEIECPMHGPKHARIAIIGEYPSANEVINKRPFSGGSGKVLWDALRPFNILQTEVYKTNVIKRQVGPKNKPPQHELTLWYEALQFELSLLPELETIICLGNAAMNALLGFDGITQYRGSVYDWNGKQVVVANNPAVVLRMPQNDIIFKMDMKRANDVIIGDFKPHRVEKKILYGYEEAIDYLDSLLARASTTKVPLSFDIETLNNNAVTACFGFATSPNKGYCIPLRGEDNLNFTPEEEYSVFNKVYDVLTHPNAFIIAQNGAFDSYFMGVRDRIHFRVHFDTLLAHHTMYPTIPHNLGFLTSQYTTYPYYKDEISAYKEGQSIDTFWEYNATDAAITFAVYEAELAELKEQKLDEFFFNHVMRMQPHLVDATVCGIKIDTDMKEHLRGTLSEELKIYYEEFQTAVRAATGDPNKEVNPASSKQLCVLLFDELGAIHRRRSADKSVRNDLMEDNRTSTKVKAILVALDRFAEMNKFFGTYVNTQIDEDNRYRAQFNQFGVAKAPGRLSSSKVAWGSGGNLQNQPRSAYPMFMVDDDTVAIYFDLAQAEARVVGWRAGIDKWKEDFERARLNPGSYDAHRALAADMFDLPYDQTPSSDENPDGSFSLRYIAKRCRHGLNYRMQPARLAATTGMLYTQAIRNFNIYHAKNPELKRWWAVEERNVRKTRQQFNAYGRRNQLFGRLDEGSLDSIIAFYPQSTIGDKTQRIWYLCHEDDQWDRNKARIGINVHDALYGFAKRSYAERTLSIMKKHAEEPIMIQNIFDNSIEPMIVPADLKMSEPGPDGVHRLSTLKTVVL